MAITTFATLKTAIKNEFARSNLDETRLEEAIRAVEVDLEEEDDFMVAFLETRATSTMVTGSQYLGIPANDILTVRMLKITTPVSPPLEYKPVHFLDQIKANDTQGQPLWYTTVGDEFRFVPTPDSDYPVELVYFKRIPALTSSNTTNFLLTNNPSIYKWGAITDLLPYVGGQNARRLADAPARYQRALDKAIRAARQRRVPRGPQRMRHLGTIV